MELINKVIDIFGLDVAHIEDVPESYSSTVVRLILKSGERCILKLPYNKSKLYREYQILNKLKSVLPVPEVLAFWKGNDSCSGAMLLSHLEGEPATKDVSEKLAYDMGRLLAQLHKIPMDNYSLMDTPSNHWLSTIKDKFYVWYDECIGHLETSLLKQCDMQFKKMIATMPEDEGPVLIHFDYRPGNILIKDEEITGIIDFESSRGGSADVDFTKSKIYLWDESPGTKGPFLKGYESVRPVPPIDRTLPFYEFFNAFGGLAWCVRRNKMTDPFFEENYQLIKKYI